MDQRTTDRVVEAAPAKVNLSLHVVGRRADGYHLLESMVAFADAGDELVLVPADRFALEITGPFAAWLGPVEDNLVLRAAQALSQAFPGRVTPAHVTLTKRLPVASGVGGGSADAAAALRGLNALSRLGAMPAELLAVAHTLGADVPVCLLGEAAFMTGIGEELAPAPALPEHGVVLVNPGREVSTAEVFERLDASPGGVAGVAHPPLPEAGWRDAAALAQTLSECHNDLEPPARALVPDIAGVLAVLDECDGILLARMSGSGATCFGLFADQLLAAAAGRQIATAYPDWWVTATRLR